ncbi:hypothetical protein [Flagellimonas sp.]|uniref:hypothetical protein n=1 Tax=Flagellimonas sp. TaxID=2058762 RepID=UPI003BAC08F6
MGNNESIKILRALAVSKEWAFMQAPDNCFLIEMNTGEVLKHIRHGYMNVFSAALSPDNKKLLLGNLGLEGFLWDLENNVLNQLAPITKNAKALGWSSENIGTFSGMFGGVVTLSVDEFLTKNDSKNKYYGIGPGQSALKYDGKELLANDALIDDQLDFSVNATSDFFLEGDDARVIELLDEDLLNQYQIGHEISHKVIPFEQDEADYDDYDMDFEEDFNFDSSPELFVCNSRIIIKNKNNLNILDVHTGENMNEWEIDLEDNEVLTNLERTKLYAYSEKTLDELDLDTKTQKTIWKGVDLKRVSVVGDILLLLFNDWTVEYVNLAQQKSMLKLAAYKSGEEIVIKNI